MTLSIVVAFSVSEGAFRLLLRFIHPLFNLSSFSKALLTLLWLLIHSRSLCPVLFISAWHFFSLEVSLSHCAFMLRVPQYNTISAQFFSPQAALRNLYTPHCCLFLFSPLLFSVKPVNNCLSGVTAISLLLIHLICDDRIRIEAYTLYKSRAFFGFFLALCWWEDLLLFHKEILIIFFFLEARLIFDRRPQGSRVPKRQVNK